MTKHPTHKPDIGEADKRRVAPHEEDDDLPAPGQSSGKGGGKYEAARASASRASDAAQDGVPGAGEDDA